jgi:hypothetical protein
LFKASRREMNQICYSPVAEMRRFSLSFQPRNPVL